MPRFSDPLADSLDDPLAWENIPPSLNPPLTRPHRSRLWPPL